MKSKNVIKKISGIILFLGGLTGVFAYAAHGELFRYAIGDIILAIDCDLITAFLGMLVAATPFVLVLITAGSLHLIGFYDWWIERFDR